jgi:hypothetical protein
MPKRYHKIARLEQRKFLANLQHNMPTLCTAIFSVHFTTFCDDTLEFYYFQDALSTAVIIDFAILLPRFKTDIYSFIRPLDT